MLEIVKSYLPAKAGSPKAGWLDGCQVTFDYIQRQRLHILPLGCLFPCFVTLKVKKFSLYTNGTSSKFSVCDHCLSSVPAWHH